MLKVIKVSTHHLFHREHQRRYTFKVANDEVTIERYVSGQLEYRIKRSIEDARWLWQRLVRFNYYQE